jgi:hypothetical protein
MNSSDPLLFRQLQVIQKIIADETWLEGERRGYPVSSADAVVRENVCRVVLRIGSEMRESALALIAREMHAKAEPLELRAEPHDLKEFQPQHTEAA